MYVEVFICPMEMCCLLNSVSGSLSLRKPAYQSSTYEDCTADKAVDGNEANNFYHKSCSCTNNDFQPWWLVDLGAEYLVSEIVITNRGDCCGKKYITHYCIVSQIFWSLQQMQWVG